MSELDCPKTMENRGAGGLLPPFQGRSSAQIQIRAKAQPSLVPKLPDMGLYRLCFLTFMFSNIIDII
jgi:hypothetical protein